ncbi:MAG: DUF1588 domain-containing protein [Myxococcota bacterium]
MRFRQAFALLGLWLVACEGAIEDGPAPAAELGPIGQDPGVAPDLAPDDTAWRPSALLTSRQFESAASDLLGVEVRAALPAENRADHFVDNAFEHVATELSEEVRFDAAEQVARSMDAAALEAALGCYEFCDATSLAPFLRRAFRSEVPLDEREALAELVRQTEDRTEGLRLLIEVVLLSPQFLYRIESLAPDTEVVEGLGNADGFTMASRLAFLLWSSGPDDALLDLAESGALEDPVVVEEQVERMVADERFARTIGSFHEQWLSLQVVAGIEKAGDGSENFRGMGPSWRESLDAFIESRFPLGLEAMLSGADLHLTPDLAERYGFAPEVGVAAYAFPEEERAGLLTHPSLMAKLAYADQDSPIARGLFVMERFLCVHPQAPPADVDLSPPPIDPESTSRERFETRTGVRPCVNCHRQFNPIGYLFGAYDTFGEFTTETASGRPIDTAAELNFLGDEVDGPYADAVELSEHLARSEQVRDCVAEQWMRFGIGRPLGEHDLRSLHLAREAMVRGDFEELLKAIATTPAMRLLRAHGDDR